MRKKVLLTSVCRPLGPKYGDAPSVGYELLYSQVTHAQGIFSPRTVNCHYSIEYIAENLDAPTVVLQYPSKAGVHPRTQEGLRLRRHLLSASRASQDEGNGRPGPPVRAPKQDRPWRLRDGSERRGARALCRLHLPRGRRSVLSPGIGRTRDPDALQAPADREPAEGVFSTRVGNGEDFRGARLPQRLRLLLHVALLQSETHQAAARGQGHLRRSWSVIWTWIRT